MDFTDVNLGLYTPGCCLHGVMNSEVTINTVFNIWQKLHENDDNMICTLVTRHKVTFSDAEPHMVNL